MTMGGNDLDGGALQRVVDELAIRNLLARLHHTIDAWKSACAPVLLLGTAAIAAALCLRRRQHFP